MHLTETAVLLEEVLPKLTYKHTLLSTNNAHRHYINGLTSFRAQISKLESVQALQQVLKPLYESSILTTKLDEATLTDVENNKLKNDLNTLCTAMSVIIALANTEDTDELNGIRIKLPPFNTFGDLNRLSGDLKLAIDVPLSNSKVESNVDVKRAESGSIWLVVILGSSAAIGLLAKLANLGLDLKMKHTQSRMHIEHLKQMKVHTKVIESVSEATTAAVQQYLDEQAKEIQDEYFSPKRAVDAVNIITASSKTFAELYAKGMEIKTTIPCTREDDESILKFPSIEQIKALRDGAKQISNNIDNQEIA